MPKQVKYTNYSFNDKETETHFAVDFSQSLDVKERHINLVVNDLSSFSVKKDMIGSPLNSVLELDIDGSKLSIGRNYETDSITFDPAGSDSVSEWIREKRGEEIPEEMFAKFLIKYREDKQEMLDRLISLLKSSKGVKRIDHSPTKLKEELAQLAPDKGEKMIRIISDIAKVEEELESQNQADTVSGQLEEKKEEMQQIVEKLDSVNGILSQQQQISSSLQQYGELLNQNLEAEAQKFERELESIRDEQLRKLAESAADSEKGESMHSDSVVRAPTIPPIGPFLAAAVLIFGLVTTLITAELQFLVAGVLFGLSSFLVWFNARLTPSEVRVIGGVKVSGPVDSEITPVNETKLKRVSVLERFFVDKAWIQALKREFVSLQQAVKEKLGGQEYKDFQQKKNTLEKEILELKKQLEGLNTVELTPEEFLSKRRNKDMLKVDKARLDADLKKSDSYQRIKELIDLLSNPEKDDVKEGIPIDLLDGFDMVRIDGTSLLFRSIDLQQWQTKDLTISEIYGLILFVKFNEWEMNPMVPLVLVNVLHHLEDGIKDFANARINQLTDVGQVILVNLAL